MRIVAPLFLTLGIALATNLPAQTGNSADAQSRTHVIAASFSKFKQLSREKHGVKKEKYIRVESEPVIKQNPAEYSGVYKLPEMAFALRLTVDSKRIVTGSGEEPLSESLGRTFTLRSGRIQGALLTATKVYADGGTEPLEGAFMNRTRFESPTDKGTTTFGFGTLSKPVEISGMTFDKFFYERSR